MPLAAPLQVTVEILLEGGSAAGRRLFRLSREISLPGPLLFFDRELPVEDRCLGKARFSLPDGLRIEAEAQLQSDPEHPELGSEAELVGLAPATFAALQSYIEERRRG
jgi:hypothetical protein